MKVLFTPMNGGRGMGPLTRCLSIAEEFRHPDNEILFFAREWFEPLINAAGHQSIRCLHAPSKKGAAKTSPLWTDIAYLIGTLDYSFLKPHIEQEIKVIEENNIDVVVSETNPTSAISAAITSTHHVSTFAYWDTDALNPLWASLRSEETLRAYNKILDEYGLSLVKDLSEVTVAFSDLLIAPTVPSLQPHIDATKCYFSGHLLYDELEFSDTFTPPPWDEGADLRVYCYVSTADQDPGLWKNFLGGLAQSGCQVRAISSEEVKTANCETWQQAPAGNLAAGADVIVNPGTANSITLGLKMGIPQIFFPSSDGERSYNAMVSEKANIGVKLSDDLLYNPQQVVKIAKQVKQNQLIKQGIRNLQQEQIESGGPKKLVEHLLHLFAK